MPATLATLLDYLQGSYYQSAPANIAAGLAGEKYYEYDYGFGTTRGAHPETTEPGEAARAR